MKKILGILMAGVMCLCSGVIFGEMTKMDVIASKDAPQKVVSEDKTEAVVKDMDKDLGDKDTADVKGDDKKIDDKKVDLKS